MSRLARAMLAALHAERLQLEAQLDPSHFDPALSLQLDRLLVEIESYECTPMALIVERTA